jgi:hypothetical protein
VLEGLQRAECSFRSHQKIIDIEKHRFSWTAHKTSQERIDAHHNFNVIVIEAACEGKTAIVDQIVTDHFSLHRKPTIDVEYQPPRFSFREMVIQFKLWETTGQEI